MINYLTVMPRNKHYFMFYINNNTENHSKKFDDMHEYLLELCPELASDLLEMLLTFQYFILDINNKKITKLNFDDLRNHISTFDEMQNMNFDKVLKEMEEKEGLRGHFRNLDDQIKKLIK